jgi:hypothetical protein
MDQDQGSVAIVDDSASEGVREAQIELPAASQDDLLEHWFVDRGYSIRRLARRFHLPEREVRRRLMALGLEVEGRTRPGLASSFDVSPSFLPQQPYSSIESCVVDFLRENPNADRSRLRMYA